MATGREEGKHVAIILKKKREFDQKRGISQAVKERRKGGMQRMYRDMAQGFKAGEKAGRNATKKDKRVTKLLNQLDPTGLGNKMIDTQLEVGGHMAGQVAGAVAAAVGTVVSFVGAAADAISELFGPNNDLERELAQGHYQKEKFFSESQGENEKYKTQKLTQAIAKGDQVTDTVITVGLTAAAVISFAGGVLGSPFTGGASIMAGLAASSAFIGALAAYKAARGLYEGGFAGAALAAGTAAANVVLEGMGSHLNVNASYSYANGFSAGIGVSTLGANDVGLGLTAGLNYNEKSGFGASVGMEYAFGGQYVPNFNVGAAYNVNSINRPGQNANISLSGRMDNYSVSAWRDIKNNNSYGGSISYSGQVRDKSVFNGYTTSLNWSNGQGFGNSFNYTFSNQFVKDASDGWDDFTKTMGNEMDDILIGLGWKMGRKEGNAVTKSHLMRESRIQDPIYNLAKERWRQKVLKEINDSWLTNGNEQVSPETLDSLLSDSDKEEFILDVIKDEFGEEGLSAYLAGKNQALKNAAIFFGLDFGYLLPGYGSQPDPSKPLGFDPIENKKNEITNKSLKDQEWLFSYGYNHSIEGFNTLGTMLSMAMPSTLVKMTKEFEVAQKYGKVISEVFDLNLAEKTNRKLFNALRGGRPDEVIKLINNMKLDSIPNSAEMIRIAEFATKAKREINIIFDETTKTSRLIVGDANKIPVDIKSNIRILAHIHPGGNPLPSAEDFIEYKKLLKLNPNQGKLNVYTYYGKYEYSLHDLNKLDKLGWIKYAD